MHSAHLGIIFLKWKGGRWYWEATGWRQPKTFGGSTGWARGEVQDQNEVTTCLFYFRTSLELCSMYVCSVRCAWVWGLGMKPGSFASGLKDLCGSRFPQRPREILRNVSGIKWVHPHGELNISPRLRTWGHIHRTRSVPGPVQSSHIHKLNSHKTTQSQVPFLSICWLRYWGTKRLRSKGAWTVTKFIRDARAVL